MNKRVERIITRVDILVSALNDLLEVVKGWEDGINTDDDLLIAYNKFKYKVAEKEET